MVRMSNKKKTLMVKLMELKDKARDKRLTKRERKSLKLLRVKLISLCSRSNIMKIRTLISYVDVYIED